MARGALVSLIYARSLKLQAGVYDESAALTLMSTDVDRITMSAEGFLGIWARLIQVAIGIWLLERQLGWICAAPIVVVLSKNVQTSVTRESLIPFSWDLWINSNRQIGKWCPESVGWRDPAPSCNDLVGSGIDEEHENAGHSRCPCWKSARPESSRIRSLSPVPALGIVEERNLYIILGMIEG